MRSNSPEVHLYQVATACNDPSPRMRPAWVPQYPKSPSEPGQVPKAVPYRVSLLLRTSENYPSRDCLETPQGLRYGVLQDCGTGRMSTFSGAWRNQKRRDPTRTATFQTVSLRTTVNKGKKEGRGCSTPQPGYRQSVLSEAARLHPVLGLTRGRLR